jgi:tetratricopeptide (TPR) repeat protein
LLFLTQVDIATNNLPAAISSAEAMVSLEPNNATRYFQLGVLYFADRRFESAIAALEEAVERDEQYANARYLLALAYDAVGRSADTRRELERVLELNPGNAEVTTLLERLAATTSLGVGASIQPTTVIDPDPVQTDNGVVGTTEAPNSRVVVPVNTPPQAASPATQDSTVPETASQATSS